MDVARGYQFHGSQYYESLPDYDFSVAVEITLGIVWIMASLLVAAASIYREGSFQTLNLVAAFRHGYSTISTAETPRYQSKRDTPNRDPPPTSPDAFNMYDPGSLPPRLAEYANMVYSACEDLGNFFGFQDSSVRNQAEHLLILLSNNRRYMSSHILPPSVQPPSPIHALHAKVFSNYMKWCRAMGVPPNFSKMNTSISAPPAVASRVVDLVLFFCIWGEASNLRHMPECVWFLYHKMMEDYIKSEGYTQSRSLYAGHYLDHVVTPVYEIIEKVRQMISSRFLSIFTNFSLLLCLGYCTVSPESKVAHCPGRAKYNSRPSEQTQL
jgi:callose synthase